MHKNEMQVYMNRYRGKSLIHTSYRKFEFRLKPNSKSYYSKLNLSSGIFYKYQNTGKPN